MRAVVSAKLTSSVLHSDSAEHPRTGHALLLNGLLDDIGALVSPSSGVRGDTNCRTFDVRDGETRRDSLSMRRRTHLYLV